MFTIFAGSHPRATNRRRTVSLWQTTAPNDPRARNRDHSRTLGIASASRAA